MSPHQKAAGIHLAFVFMTIQGRGQQQVRPTEIHRDYFVDVGCLCSDGVFYNRLFKPCCSLFVLVSWQSRLEHGNYCGFPESLFCFSFFSGKALHRLLHHFAQKFPKFTKCKVFGLGSDLASIPWIVRSAHSLVQAAALALVLS